MEEKAKKSAKKTKETIIETQKKYTIIGTGKSDNLKQGVEKIVTGEIAKILIEKKAAKLK